MRQYKRSIQWQIDLYNKCWRSARKFYTGLFSEKDPQNSKWMQMCIEGFRSIASHPHKKQQDEWFVPIGKKLLSEKKVMIFLVPNTDVVTGGIMSICNIATRSQEMQQLHGCEVLLTTMPGKETISRYTQFNNDCKIFRFEQIQNLFSCLEKIYIQIPDIYVAPFGEYLKSYPDLLKNIPERCLNILNQNIELMPSAETVKELAGYFSCTTQTCAHAKYCTLEKRHLFQMPLHLLPAEIPGEFYQIPYAEKENLVAYSNDRNPYKEEVLKKLKELLPEYRFLMIQGMTYDEYRKTISHAKWVLTFGEGWDCYYLQPYFSNSIGFTVFNSEFCPEYMKDIPTVFPDYETLPERMVQFIRTYDKESCYSEMVKKLRDMIYPPAPNAPPNDALLEFYKGNYTFS